jgi:ribosomal protein S12 methylthiotransferase
MQRETSGAYIRDLVRRIRKGIPGIALRTTFIVGFPGETEADVDELCDSSARPGSSGSASSATPRRRAPGRPRWRGRFRPRKRSAAGTGSWRSRRRSPPRSARGAWEGPSRCSSTRPGSRAARRTPPTSTAGSTCPASCRSAVRVGHVNGHHDYDLLALPAGPASRGIQGREAGAVVARLILLRRLRTGR